MKLSNLRASAGGTRSVDGDDPDFSVVGEVHHISRSNRKKVLYLLYLQKLEGRGSRKTELRLGYYTLGTKPGGIKGKWIWARYEVILDAMDLRAIISKAEKKGWL